MIDIGLSKMALIGVVALVVIGPEKKRVAALWAPLLGKAQRYVADVKSEVNRSMELDELQEKRRETVENARDVEQSVHGRQRFRERLGRGDRRGQRGAGG